MIATTAPDILARTAEFLQAVDGSMVIVGNRSRVLPLSATQLLADELLDLAGVGIAVTTDPYTPPGFVPYSKQEMEELFGEGKDAPSPEGLRLIHEAKKCGARVIGSESEHDKESA